MWKKKKHRKGKNKVKNINVTTVCHELTTAGQGTNTQRSNNSKKQDGDSTKDCVNTTHTEIKQTASTNDNDSYNKAKKIATQRTVLVTLCESRNKMTTISKIATMIIMTKGSTLMTWILVNFQQISIKNI